MCLFVPRTYCAEAELMMMMMLWGLCMRIVQRAAMGECSTKVM